MVTREITRDVTITFHFGLNFPIGNPADESEGWFPLPHRAFVAFVYILLTSLDTLRDKCCQEDLQHPAQGNPAPTFTVT